MRPLVLTCCVALLLAARPRQADIAGATNAEKPPLGDVHRLQWHWQYLHLQNCAALHNTMSLLCDETPASDHDDT